MLISFVDQILFGKIKSLNADNFNKNDILYFQSRKIKVKNPQLAPFHIDGDPMQTSKEFFIEILPSAYKLIRP
jgi:diacylglycerol kinase family enzyme